MNFKQKCKNYGFWVSLVAAIIVMLRTIGQKFGFTIDDEAIRTIANSILGVLIVMGIISNPASGKGYVDEEKQNEKPKN